MPTDVETQLRALGRHLEREVAHVDADEVLAATTIVELETTIPNGVRPRRGHARRIGPSGERHRWRFIVAAVAVAIVGVLVVVLGPDGQAPPRPPSATTTSWPTSPYPWHGVRPLFPEAGPLARGEHRWILKPRMPTPIYNFTLSATGWRSGGDKDVPGGGGWIEKGTPGTPDGAVITFWRPDRVSTDPCGHTLVTPLSSAVDFSRAVAAIPGTGLVSGPTTRSSSIQGFWRINDQRVVLMIPEDIDCDPQQFYLWADGEHARAATARGSTITVSIIDSWPGPPVFVEAETYKGASPELEQEVQQIVDSLSQEGGIG